MPAPVGVYRAIGRVFVVAGSVRFIVGTVNVILSQGLRALHCFAISSVSGRFPCAPPILASERALISCGQRLVHLLRIVAGGRSEV